MPLSPEESSLLGSKLGASWISEHLWQGGTPPLGNAVKQAGIDVLISCQQELLILPSELPGIEVHHVSLRDCYDPTEIEILGAQQAAEVATLCVTNKRNVLIHCAAGLNRSGFVMALTLKSLLGLTGYQARLIIQANRQGALFNEVFCRIIEKGDPK